MMNVILPSCTAINSEIWIISLKFLEMKVKYRRRFGQNHQPSSLWKRKYTRVFFKARQLLQLLLSFSLAFQNSLIFSFFLHDAIVSFPARKQKKVLRED